MLVVVLLLLLLLLRGGEKNGFLVQVLEEEKAPLSAFFL